MVSVPPSLSAYPFSRRNRLIIYYALGLVALVLFYTVAYNVIMSHLEGVHQSIFASFEFVIQTMTTTGYGQDSGHWSHPITFMFVSLTQISGIGIGFFTLRLIIIPLFTDAEVNLDDRLSPKADHVVICEYNRDSTVLLDELRDMDVEYVLISSDREEAKDLSDAGYAAIHGSPQDASAFERANLTDARAVIADAGDANVNTILTVRSLRDDVEVIALTDDGDTRELLLDTGADTVLSPRAALGQRLAEKAVSAFDTDLEGIELGADLELTEVPVPHGSPLIGQRIRDTAIRERSGATIVGAWIDGELQLPPSPDAVIRQNTVLLVAGGDEAMATFSEFARPVRSLQRHDRIVIAGAGEVGQAAREVVEDAGIDAVAIDVTDGEAVDIVGDASERDVLETADLAHAGAVIVALPDDSAALLTTVLARSLNPNIEILVRVMATDATNKALSAGADFVLSVPRVSARMVARELLGEDVLEPASQIRLIRVPAHPLAGRTVADSGIYETTGCRIVAVEDEAGVTTAVEPSRQLTGEERLTLVGSDENVHQFLREYDVTPTDG